MIPPVFFTWLTLPWLLAGRCAAAYWETIADVLAADDRSDADIVALPPPGPGRRLPRGHIADLILLAPKRR
jgi:hypothetical protein